MMVPLRRSARLGASNSPALSGIVQSVGSAAGKDRSQDGHLATRGPNNKKGKSGASSSTRPEPPVKDEQQPVTPSRKRKRKRKSSIQASPAIATATPSAVRLMAASHVLGERDHATVSVPDRPAQPYKTNAPLVSSETSKIVAYQDGVVDPSPSKQQVLEAATTTGNILVRACAHLISVEPSLRAVIEKHHCPLFSPEGLAEEIDPFRSLASGIIAQQVSGAAAKSIKNKFVALFNESVNDDKDNDQDAASHTFPTPSQVAASDLAHLRTAGLSGRKAEYIKGLAEKFASGEFSAEMLIQASDAEVLEKLTAVRGLGRWSVEMFACFALKRMDVFSTGDLGVQRGMAAYLGKDVKKLKAKGGGKWKYLSEKEMLDVSAKFAPYRSLFMWYMWRIEDVNLDAVQDN